MMESYVLIYNGNYKISAIRSLRRHVKITLKEAKNCILHLGGFILTGDTSSNLLKDYLDNDTVHYMTNIQSWSVQNFTDQVSVDLRDREIVETKENVS